METPPQVLKEMVTWHQKNSCIACTCLPWNLCMGQPYCCSGHAMNSASKVVWHVYTVHGALGSSLICRQCRGLASVWSLDASYGNRWRFWDRSMSVLSWLQFVNWDKTRFFIAAGFGFLWALVAILGGCCFCCCRCCGYCGAKTKFTARKSDGTSVFLFSLCIGLTSCFLL